VAREAHARAIPRTSAGGARSASAMPLRRNGSLRVSSSQNMR
jgi:hypothetical protein